MSVPTIAAESAAHRGWIRARESSVIAWQLPAAIVAVHRVCYIHHQSIPEFTSRRAHRSQKARRTTSKSQRERGTPLQEQGNRRSRFTMLQSPTGPSSWMKVSPLEVLITRACEPSLHEPNYALHLEVAEYINQKKANKYVDFRKKIIRFAFR